MRVFLIFIFFALTSCSNTQNSIPYEWFHTDIDRKEKWLEAQDEKLFNYKSQAKLDSFEANNYDFNPQQDTKSVDSVLIGNNLFFIGEEGVFSKEIERKPFLWLRNLDFIPKFLPVNKSNYLIIYGSVNHNDINIVQVWDIQTQKMIHQYTTNDVRKSQSTKSNLYYLKSLDNEEQWMKFNYHRKFEQPIFLKQVNSLKVIDSTFFYTRNSKKINLFNDFVNEEKITVETGFLNKDFMFLGKKDDNLYFFENLPQEIAFYKTSVKDSNFQKVFTKKERVTVEDIQLVGDNAYFTFIKNGKNNFSIFDFSTNDYRHLLRDELASLKFRLNSKPFLIYSSYKVKELRYEISNHDSLVLINEDINKEILNYKLEQRWIHSSNDSLPIIIYYKEDFFDSSPPVIVNVYGGFRKTLMPYYSSYINHFIEKGGVYVIAGVRGGGEKGIDWHSKATIQNKKNTFLDFENCLTYIGKHITNPDKIAIYGASNGGLVVNHAVVNYSEKFNVAVSMFGLSDMENYTSYDQPKWINEFGNPSNKNIRKYLKSYSPLQNIDKLENKNLKLLLITGDKDKRVSPLNSYKFAYALLDEENDVYLKVFKDVGHGFTGAKLQDLYNEVYSFIFYHLGTEKH